MSKKDAHPLPQLEDIIDNLSEPLFFSTLYLAIGYHQVQVGPDDREKTAFSTPSGLFEYNVLPFGVATAPAKIIKLMTPVVNEMLYNTCLVFFDDIIILGKTLEDMYQRLDQARYRLEQPISS